MHQHIDPKENVASLALRSFLNFLFGFVALLVVSFVAITVVGNSVEEIPPADLAAPLESTD